MVTNSASGTICNCDLSIYRQGSPSGNVTLAIYTTTNDSTPVIQVGGDSDPIACSGMSTSPQTNNFTWSANYPTVGASNFIMVIKTSVEGNSTNNLSLRLHNPYVAGVLKGGETNFNVGVTYNRRPYYILRKQ